LAKAMQKLTKHNISVVPLKEGGKYVGFVSFVDLVSQVVSMFSENGKRKLCVLHVRNSSRLRILNI
jgi:hypothetical protein